MSTMSGRAAFVLPWQQRSHRDLPGQWPVALQPTIVVPCDRSDNNKLAPLAYRHGLNKQTVFMSYESNLLCEQAPVHHPRAFVSHCKHCNRQSSAPALQYHQMMEKAASWLRFRILKAAITKIVVLWVVAPCSLVQVYRSFGGACCLHLLPYYTTQQPRSQPSACWVS
jgi:hypothetical protein